jgi:hypothetical protein
MKILTSSCLVLVLANCSYCAPEPAPVPEAETKVVAEPPVDAVVDSAPTP